MDWRKLKDIPTGKNNGKRKQLYTLRESIINMYVSINSMRELKKISKYAILAAQTVT